jgi:hypothetical protein
MTRSTPPPNASVSKRGRAGIPTRQAWTSAHAPASSRCPLRVTRRLCVWLRPFPRLCTRWWPGWSRATWTRWRWNPPAALGCRAAGAAGAHALSRYRAACQDRTRPQSGVERCPVAAEAAYPGAVTRLWSSGCRDACPADAAAASGRVDRALGLRGLLPGHAGAARAGASHGGHRAQDRPRGVSPTQGSRSVPGEVRHGVQVGAARARAEAPQPPREEAGRHADRGGHLAPSASPITPSVWGRFLRSAGLACALDYGMDCKCWRSHSVKASRPDLPAATFRRMSSCSSTVASIW